MSKLYDWAEEEPDLVEPEIAAEATEPLTQQGAVEVEAQPPAPKLSAVQKTYDLRPIEREYLEWFVDPDPGKGSKKAWARDHGITEGIPRTWEQKDVFQKALNQRLAELNINPMRVQQVVDAMFLAAGGGNVPAAKLVLDYMNKINPHAAPVVEDKSVADLTDAELNAKLDELRREL